MKKKCTKLTSYLLAQALVVSMCAVPGGYGVTAKAEESSPLIVNGDFETNDLSSWTVTSSRETAGVQIADWAKRGGSYGLVAKDTQEWVDGGNDNVSTVELKQTVAALPAGEYILTVYGRGNGGNGLKLIQNGEVSGETQERTKSWDDGWQEYTFGISLEQDVTNYVIGIQAELSASGGNTPYCLDDISLTPKTSNGTEDQYLDVYSEDYDEATTNSKWTSEWVSTDNTKDAIEEKVWKTWSQSAQDVKFTANFTGLEAGEYRLSLVAVGGKMDASKISLGDCSKDLLINPWGGATPTVTDTVTVEANGSLEAVLELSFQNGGWCNLDDIKLQKKTDADTLKEAAKTKLETLVTECATLQENFYSEKTWNVLEAALGSANTLLENENASLEELENAYKALKRAKNQLMVGSVFVNKVEGLSSDFIRGVDVSSYISVVDSGAKFKDATGKELEKGKEFFDLLAESGVNWVRLRIWNDPYDADGNGYGGGNNDLEKAIRMGKWATEAGMKVLIDFHYSDFWADPGRQLSPKAWRIPDAGKKVKEWEDISLEEKVTKLSEYTETSLNSILDAGVDVGMVQVGNETNNGIAGETNWANMPELFKAGCAAVRKVAGERQKEIKVALHFTDPQVKNKLTTFAKRLSDAEVDYDVFASSYYPATHGTMENITKVLSDVAKAYHKEVMVAETSWAWTDQDGDGHGQSFDPGTYTDYAVSIQGQATEVRDVVQAVHNVNKVDGCEGKGIGAFYWEPAWIPASYAYDEDGASVSDRYDSNKEKWEKYGSGVASSYAVEYDTELYDKTEDKEAKRWDGGSVKDNEAFFDFNGNPLPTLTIFRDVYEGREASVVRLEKIKDGSVEILLESTDVTKDWETIKGKLPKTVQGVYNDSSYQAFPVVWNTKEIEEKVTDFGNYTISGTVSYRDENGNDMVDSVRCKVAVFPDSILENGDFENKDDGSWIVGNEDKVELKWEDTPMRGEGTVHFYNADPFSFTLVQTVTAEKSGFYCASGYIQGDGASIKLEVTNLNTKMSESGTKETSGWAVWNKCLTENVEAAKGDSLQVTITISGSAGAWGSIDDIFCYCAEEKEVQSSDSSTYYDYNYPVASAEPEEAQPSETPAVQQTEAPAATQAPSSAATAAPAASTVPAAGVSPAPASASPEAVASAAPTASTAAPAASEKPAASASPDTETSAADEKPEKGTEITKKDASYEVTSSTDSKKDTVSYTGTTNEKATAITVPAVVKKNGVSYKVTSIVANAFKGNTAIKTLTVGKNVKTIGQKAFAGAVNLKNVTLGTGVKKIGAKAFDKTKKLKVLTVKSGLLTKKGVKNALKGSSVKKIVLSGKQAKKQLEKYKKIFTKKNCGKSVTIVVKK